MKLALFIIFVLFLAACGGSTNVNQANTANGANTAPPEKQTLTVVERPQKIKALMTARGEQDNAAPEIEINGPKGASVSPSSTVKVSLILSGDLKGYRPHMDMESKTGNHVHIILDNQPYEAYYSLDQPFELRNVADGEHTLRVFPSRPWHESYKNEDAFSMVNFTIKNGGADASKPATTASGNTIANASVSPTPEGRDMQPSAAGAVDHKKPVLTYSRPKGEYKGVDADAIMIDFWLTNAKLVGDGGEYRVRWSVDGSEPQFIDKWAPIWLSGWTAGKHSVKVELVDKDGNPVDNGGYNSTTREITVTK